MGEIPNPTPEQIRWGVLGPEQLDALNSEAQTVDDPLEYIKRMAEVFNLDSGNLAEALSSRASEKTESNNQ